MFVIEASMSLGADMDQKSAVNCSGYAGVMSSGCGVGRDIWLPSGRRALSSIRTVAAEHDRKRLRKDVQVKSERAGTDVAQVHADHFIEWNPATTFHLPDARHARLDGQYAA